MAKTSSAKPTRRRAVVCQCLVVLAKTDPLVWRRIQVPENYSFWDLHVAIQDAMGWKDCHLHEFSVVDRKTGRAKRIGIPDLDDPDERPCLAGWKVPMTKYLSYRSDPARYRYDFGDDWEHVLEFEGVVHGEGGSYPRCVAGAGHCPPEDVGGVHGYESFLEIIRNTRHPEHEETMAWAGGRFDPHEFREDTIAFDNPRERWEKAFLEPADSD